MKEYSREEINELWKHAYYRASNTTQQAAFTWMAVLLLLLPVALFGFPTNLIRAWLPIAIITLSFFYYGRLIWQRSEKGKYQASKAIFRNLFFGTYAFSLLWLFMLLTSFGFATLGKSSSNLLLVVGITVMVYLVTVPIAFNWGQRQTHLLFEKNRVVVSKGLNFFGGRTQVFFIAMAVFLSLTMIVLLPVDFAPRGVFVGILLGPGAALAIFIFLFGNVYLIWTLYKNRFENGPYQATLKEVKKQLKEERKAGRKGPTRIPVWCEGCNAQGEIEVDDSEGNYFVICEVCSTETAEVWCDEGVGGQFVRNIHEHPFEYDCEICKKTHQLPTDFYETPVTLELIEEPRKKKK